MKKTVILIFIFSVLGTATAEKIYKWVDENGQIHYSSKKPKEQQVETVKIRKGPKVAAAQDEDKKQTSTTTDNTETEADAAARAQLAKADAINNQRLCEQARKNIATLNATVRVTKVDEETGETIRMNDDQRLEALKNAQQSVKEYCQ